MESIKDILKKSKLLVLIVIRFRIIFKCTLTIISPVLNSRYHYKKEFKRKLNLKNPHNFNEKLLWLKLNTYYKNQLVTKCADKYAVRDYVKECGYESILNELYGVYNCVEDIPWNELPNKFALKWNFGCGFNIICTDKSKINIEETKRQLKKWGKRKYYLQYSEMQYKNTIKRLICERYLDTEQGFLPYDYKVYCFNGEPKAILVCMERENSMKAVFMSPSWEFIDAPKKYGKVNQIPAKPEGLDMMLESASCLSKPFPFVRIDYYMYRRNAIFGEMTFTPAGCLYTSQTNAEIMPMGEMLQIK